MQISGLGDAELGITRLYKLAEAKNIHESAPGECELEKRRSKERILEATNM